MKLNQLDIQQEAAQSIKSAIDNNRMPHALLISGKEGCGALRLALATAEEILGVTPQQALHVQHLQHMDLLLCFPVVNKQGQSGETSATSDEYMSEWREAVLNNPDLTYTEWVGLISKEGKMAQIYVNEANRIIAHLNKKPYEGDNRVVIIWMPERINEQTSNKLLKIIEEPYERTYILMVSAEPERIIGTIQSRCQRINLPPLTPNWMQPTMTDEDRKEYFDLFVRMMRDSYARRIFNMREWTLDMDKLGRERQQAFLKYAQSLVRDNYMLNMNDSCGGGLNDITYMETDEADFASKFHLFITERNVEGIMEELALAETDIAGNCLAKIVFFDLSLKLIMLLKNK